MLRNIPKRPVADAWSLETTTMYEPGMGSVAEFSHAYAETVQSGEISDPRLFFDHRQADEKWDLEDPDQFAEAIVEASGDALAYTDIEAILGTWQDPQQDPADFQRFWLNQRWVGSGRWIKRLVWDERVEDDQVSPSGEVHTAASTSPPGPTRPTATKPGPPAITLSMTWRPSPPKTTSS